MKKKIFTAILGLCLLCCPAFAACKKSPPTPPKEPSANNVEAEAKLEGMFDYTFFPFDKVEITKINYSQGSTDILTGFEFTCEDIEALRLEVKSALVSLGFSQDANDETFSYSKKVDNTTTTFAISEGEDKYIFTITTFVYTPSSIEIFDSEVLKILGFSFDLPSTLTATPLELEEGTLLHYQITGISYDEFMELLSPKFEENGFSLDGPFSMLLIEDNFLTITIEDFEDSLTITISEL